MPKDVAGPSPISQVCIVARDAARTSRWYTEGLGMLPAGRNLFFGKPAERVQAVPRPLLLAHWALDRQGFFQVEIFQYRRPRSRPRSLDWTPADWGYSVIGVHVRDLGEALQRLAAQGSHPLTKPLGSPGDRRILVPDPDGNLVELLERDPLELVAPLPERPDLGATVRLVRLSVPDLEAFCEGAVRGLGLVREQLDLHGPEHERLWGLEGAKRRAAVLRGAGVALEVVQYERPRGRPWPAGYRLSDLGYMNIAVGFTDTGAFERQLARARTAGWTPHGKRLEIGMFRVVYLDDADGIDVEMLRPRPWARRLTGFAPSVPYAVAERHVRAAPEAIWEPLSDLPAMQEWAGLTVRLQEPGPPGPGYKQRVRMLGRWVEEEIVRWDPPHGYAYRLTGLAPLSGLRGELSVAPADGGSRVRWAVRFRSRVPFAGRLAATLLERRMGRALARAAARAGGDGRSGQSSAASCS